MAKRSRGLTVNEAYFPQPPAELVALAEAWLPDASHLIFDAIWAAYDRLASDERFVGAVRVATDDLERGISARLEIAIHEVLSGDEPFDVQHEVPEGESRQPPPAKPPTYDIAFIHYGNPRIMWPVEAKIMPPDRPLSEYIGAIEERYIPCIYAPFSMAGGMVGFVLSGSVSGLFDNISRGLGLVLGTLPERLDRPHRVSVHRRVVPPGKPFPDTITLHHLLMSFEPDTKVPAARPAAAR